MLSFVPAVMATCPLLSASVKDAATYHIALANSEQQPLFVSSTSSVKDIDTATLQFKPWGIN